MFLAGDPRHTFGKQIEAAAVVYLTSLGWQLRHRNWKGRGGEIDLVFDDGRHLVIVEVKARHASPFTKGRSPIAPDQLRRLWYMGLRYRKAYNLINRPWRIDLLEARPIKDGWRWQHFRGLDTTWLQAPRRYR